MKIPKQFQLLGHTITVEFDPQLAVQHDNTGAAHYRLNKIILQGEEGYVGRPQSKIGHDFCHELVHFLLYYSECSDTKDLFRNEMFVDRLAGLLHQVLSSMEVA